VKRLVLFAFLLSLPSFLHADTRFELELNDFTEGLDKRLADKISLKSLQDCLNMHTDRVLGASRRSGFKLEASCLETSTLGTWSFISPSNDEWLIRIDCRGNLIAGRQIGSTGACFSVCVSTNLLSTIYQTDADVGLGKIWFTNPEDGLMSWDGTEFKQYPDAPRAARVSIYKGRVVLADITNEQSSIRLSGALDGSDWVNDSKYSTFPVSLEIGGVDDGNKV